MRAWHLRRRDDRGAAAVEFALISIPLFLLLFGIIQFGFVFFSQITISQAARDGARFASLQVPCDATCVTNTKNRIISDASPGVNVLASNITVSPTCTANSTQNTATSVAISYQVDIALLFTITIKANASSPCGG